MEMNNLLPLFVLFIFLAKGSCSNILALFACPSHSHYVLGHTLLKELAAKGHNVTMITSSKQDKKIENYNEIYLEGLTEKLLELKTEVFAWKKMYAINQIRATYNMGYIITNFTLNYKPVLDLLKSNHTFDLFILENFQNEAFWGIPHLLKTPTIIFSTMGSSLWNNHLVANPAPLAYVPSMFLNYKGDLNFYQRINNLFVYITEELYRRFIAFPYHDKILHNAFPHVPTLNNLLYTKIPIILLNSHVSVSDAVPHVPNMVEVGGIHIKPQTLSKDLQHILDESKEGVIFFSLGTNIKSTMLSEFQLNVIFKAIKKLKQKVLWKCDAEGLPGKPNNLLISKWYPQEAILAHPNTKAFITHSGLLSLIEAVHYGIPIISIPIFADQFKNSHLAVDRGYAIELDINNLTEESLSNALLEILYNKTYEENMKLWSTAMKDRVIHPLKEAVYWVEYVIRHKGASNFHSKAMNLKWYQYEMLDVAVFLFLITFAFLISIGIIIQSQFKIFFLSVIKCKACLEKKKN